MIVPIQRADDLRDRVDDIPVERARRSGERTLDNARDARWPDPTTDR